MHPWNCCRICLSEESLHPIFTLPEHNEKYTKSILLATGVKIEINDNLPQEMCSSCIYFINESVKFHKKAEAAQKILLHRAENQQYKDIKLELSNNCKSEGERNNSEIIIDIPDSVDNDFKDYDDNITLDTFQYYNDKYNDDTNQVENKISLQDVVDQTTDIVFTKKKRRCVKEKSLGSSRTKECKEMKKRTKEKKERIKEEIECEYCHKILTSKLSLRNHYKIHTGFDVVCEHCGKKFITRRLLLMHCRAKHGYEKTDKCSYCDYKASNAEQVKIHERLHTGEKPYVCKECGAGFHRKSSYLQHIAIHLPEKNVQCDQCPARFKSVTLMRIHRSRHRAPRYTFRCRVCDNGFARRRNVARHLQRVHGLQPDPQHIDRLNVG